MFLKIKSFLFVVYAKFMVKKILNENLNGIFYQDKIWQQLVKDAVDTMFGKEHGLGQITNLASFKEKIPLRQYEDFIPYIEKINQGHQNILWKGIPLYFAKTSGTTAIEKLIPISKESIQHHIIAARNILIFHAAQQNKALFLQGKMIFIQGSPKIENKKGISIGRLSGIVFHHVPAFFHQN